MDSFILMMMWIWISTLHLIISTTGANPTPSDLASTSKPSLLKVRIAHNLAKISIRGLDLRISDRIPLKLQQQGMASWNIECSKTGIVAKRADEGASVQLKAPVQIQSPSGIFQAQNQPIRNGMTLILSPKGCDVIQEMSFESLVEATVAEQDTRNWPAALLDSEVIIQRSRLYFSLLKSREQPNPVFNVEAPFLLGLENASRYTEDFRIASSVKRTEAQILALGPKEATEVFQAHSHRECAGRTELPEYVWGKTLPGYQQSVICPTCLSLGSALWKTEIHEKEIINKILAGLQWTGVPSQWPSDWNRWFVKARLRRIEISKRNESNRAQIISLVFAFNENAEMKFEVTSNAFRNWMGMDLIKSTRFSVAAQAVHSKENRFFFEGLGSGHGVGLCQHGARSMASNGISTQNILKHYFPQAEIRKL